MVDEEQSKYPVGRFTPLRRRLTGDERSALIEQIVAAPRLLREAVAELDEKALETPYRPGGWTARQVVHHLPDSHMNAYIRFKLALTEENPTIRPYDEAKWAELADSRDTPVETSMTLLDTLHRRWETLLRSMSGGDFARKLVHPDIGEIDLDFMLELYSWHGRHHVGHVQSVKRGA